MPTTTVDNTFELLSANSSRDTRSLPHLRWMNDADTPVTREVISIKGEDRAHLMNGHRGNDPSIVDLNAGYPMLKH